MDKFPTDTYLDGLGVMNDQPLTEGSRIRFVIDPENRERDITVRVEDGELYVIGPWRTLIARQTSPNRLSVSTPE